jgi:putative ABC transport system permease protein
MNWITKLGRRLRFVFREDEVEQELSDEIRHHVEMEAEELVRTGWDPAKARAEAQRRFGGEGPTKERVRDQRGGRLLGDLVQDVHYGLRILRRAPAFASMTVATLAIGIGATTAIFSVVYAVLLTPLPYEQPASGRPAPRVWTGASCRRATSWTGRSGLNLSPSWARIRVPFKTI